MAGLIGADVEALERLAADFDDGAQELRDLAAQLAGSIEDARDWQGPDAERCKDEWGTFAQEQMTGVSDALADGRPAAGPERPGAGAGQRHGRRGRRRRLRARRAPRATSARSRTSC